MRDDGRLTGPVEKYETRDGERATVTLGEDGHFVVSVAKDGMLTDLRQGLTRFEVDFLVIGKGWRRIP